MGSRVLLQYTEQKTGVTVFVYEKISIYFSEERILVLNLLEYQCARAVRARK